MRSGVGETAWAARLARVVVLVALMAAGSFPFVERAAAANPCATSGPSAAYSVTVCLTAPADGSTLSGPRTVAGTVSVSGTSPGIQRVVFYLRGAYLLTDFSNPYTFTIDTPQFVDGPADLEIEALMRDGFVSSHASVSVSLVNGVSSPPVNTNVFVPSPGTWSGSGPIIVAAAGDGASGEPNAQAATDLISSWNPNLMLYLGDVYEKGTPTEFDNWYGSPTTFYGRFRGITNPAIGNHEYEGGVAPGYFDYWDNVPHNYSYTIGSWHFISLDSTTQFGQTAAGTPQVTWLANDLATNTSPCTIAYFHHPVFSVGPNGDTTRLNTVWSMLAAAGVDLVLAGHDHDYQRWLPLDGNGAPSAGGPTQFVVGTGGHGIQGFARTDARLAVGFDTSPGAIGALRLQLSDGLAGFEFVNSTGTVLDTGSVACTPGASDTTAPTAPTGLTATPTGANRVDLSWGAASDDVGVVAYDIFRNGSLRTSVAGSVLTWADTTVAGSTLYSYTVVARDLAGNTSPPSEPATLTTPPASGIPIFSDGFESGGLAAWTNQGGVTVQGSEAYAGSWAARAAAVNGAAWAWHGLSPTMNELYYRVRFKIVSVGANNVYILKERTSTGGSIFGLYVSSTDSTLSLRNDAGSVTVRSTTPVSLGTWHELQVRLRIAGTAGEIETWLDGARIEALSRTDNFGTAPVGRIQIGDNSGARTFDVAIDDVAVDTVYVGGPPPADTSPPSAPGGLAAVATSGQRVDLSWEPSSDDTGVVSYDVYRDDDILDTVVGTATTYGDTGVSPGATYAYLVRARDAAGNVSDPSNVAQVTTPGVADSTAPTVPDPVSAEGTSVTAIQVAWGASSDDVGVAGYTVYRDGIVAAILGPAVLSWTDGGLAPATPHDYQVDAFDAAGNHSAPSVPVTGTTLPDTTAPSSPGGFVVTGTTVGSVSLAWTASTDDVGVAAYDVRRDGEAAPVASLSPASVSWTDTAVGPGETHSYTVTARDGAGNPSPPAGPVTATTPATAPPLVADDFESGTLGGWTNAGLVITTGPVNSGAFAAMAVSTGSPAWAWTYLSTPANEVYVRTWLRFDALPSKTTTALKLRTATGGAIMGLLVTGKGRLSYRNDVSARTVNSTTTLSMATWHEVIVHLTTVGSSSTVEVWLDGTLVSGLSRTDNFGTVPVGRFQLGENQSGRRFNVTYDDVEVRGGPF